ncbi:hypothetical protein BT69DRAFT_1329143 [Atractiella rhizophila]|nr:hypothetical protein BT69DRAFT_1329143 [Atractiella rhizophila]
MRPEGCIAQQAVERCKEKWDENATVPIVTNLLLNTITKTNAEENQLLDEDDEFPASNPSTSSGPYFGVKLDAFRLSLSSLCHLHVVGAALVCVLIDAGELEDPVQDAQDLDYFRPEVEERLSVEPEGECSDDGEAEMNRATADALREMRNGDDGKGKTRSQRKREKERDSKKKWEGVTGRAEDVFTDQEDSSTDKEPNADGKQKKTGGVTRGKATIKFCYESIHN